MNKSLCKPSSVHNHSIQDNLLQLTFQHSNLLHSKETSNPSLLCDETQMNQCYELIYVNYILHVN